MAEETKERRLPERFEPYRELFQNTGGNSIEGLLNDTSGGPGNTNHTNPIRATMALSVSSQLALLARLEAFGFLIPASDHRECGRCGKAVGKSRYVGNVPTGQEHPRMKGVYLCPWCLVSIEEREEERDGGTER